MRKPLLDMAEIDRFLLAEMSETDRFLFKVRMIAAPALRQQVKQQRRAHRLISWYAREMQRAELNALHEELQQDASFHQSITTIFS